MAADDLTATLPDELKALYVDASQQLMPSAYDNFTPKAKPWKWCHSSPTRATVARVADQRAQAPFDGLIAKGDASSFEVSDSNGDVSQQINQVRTFIESGCSIITAIPGSSTGLDDVIKASFDAGIPFVTVSAYVTSPYAINVDSNYGAWGRDMMAAIAKTLDGKGNILFVEGIAGAPIVEMQRGAESCSPSFGLKIARSVNGNWTANVTKTVVLQALATNPAPIDAVWTRSIAAEAFAEAGRPPRDHRLDHRRPRLLEGQSRRYRFEDHAVLPGWNAQALFRVGERILNGQKPKLNVLMIPIRRSRAPISASGTGVHDAGRRVGVPGAADRPDAGSHDGRLLQQPGAHRPPARCPAPAPRSSAVAASHPSP
jgi:ribose transport system substrate-binding protein